MYEEHLCVVALTSIEREPSSFRLPLTSLCDLPLLFFVYFQVNNGVLYFLDFEDIFLMVLSVLVSMFSEFIFIAYVVVVVYYYV